jgi:hypothetical protein
MTAINCYLLCGGNGITKHGVGCIFGDGNNGIISEYCNVQLSYLAEPRHRPSTYTRTPINVLHTGHSIVIWTGTEQLGPM